MIYLQLIEYVEENSSGAFFNFSVKICALCIQDVYEYFQEKTHFDLNFVS